MRLKQRLCLKTYPNFSAELLEEVNSVLDSQRIPFQPQQ